MNGTVVAIDGPAGSGKSTVARGVAAALGLHTLDTGAMYRAVTLRAERVGVDANDGAGLGAVAEKMALEMGERVVLDGDDVTEEIRSAAVDAEVSIVAAHPEVRRELVRRQRAWAEAVGVAVMEGRDIGSVVLPDAKVKVYLTASAAERARRRATERGEGADHDGHAASIAARDEIDSGRADSPLVVAEGAVVIDSTDKSVDDVVDEILALYG